MRKYQKLGNEAGKRSMQDRIQKVEATSADDQDSVDIKRQRIARRLFRRIANSKCFREVMPPPSNVNIETIRLCNGHCVFCSAAANSGIDDPLKGSRMSMGTYRRIVYALPANGICRISFHVNSEPLLDPLLAERIAHARSKFHKTTIRVMTNGIRLSEEVAENLFHSGMTMLDVSNYDDSDTLRETVAAIRRRWSQNSVRIFERRYSAKLFNRAGHNPSVAPSPTPFPGIGCHYPFTQMNIAFDGRVGQCCCDYFLEGGWGNLCERPFEQVWNGKVARKLRAALLRGRRIDNPLCRRCDYPGLDRNVLSGVSREERSLYSSFFPQE